MTELVPAPLCPVVAHASECFTQPHRGRDLASSAERVVVRGHRTRARDRAARYAQPPSWPSVRRGTLRPLGAARARQTGIGGTDSSGRNIRCPQPRLALTPDNLLPPYMARRPKIVVLKIGSVHARFRASPCHPCGPFETMRRANRIGPRELNSPPRSPPVGPKPRWPRGDHSRGACRYRRPVEGDRLGPVMSPAPTLGVLRILRSRVTRRL